MRILITGAGGLIGKKLVTRLLSEPGYRLRVLLKPNQQSSPFPQTVEVVFGDILNRQQILAAIADIDVIIHLAGITHTNRQSLYYDINTEGTRNLLMACHDVPLKKFIFIGSRAASLAGGAYAHSKLSAERLVMQSPLPWLVLKLAEVYGTGEQEAMTKLIRQIQQHGWVPVIGNGDYTLTPVYIDDVISAIIAAVKTTHINKSYVIAGPEVLTYNELVDRLADKFNKKIKKIHLPVWVMNYAAILLSFKKHPVITRDQIPRLLCDKPTDITPAQTDLNFRPRTLAAGIQELMPH